MVQKVISKGGIFINDDEYEYNLQNKRKIRIYAPKNKSAFKKLFNNFNIIELGEVYFNYFEFKNHEFIACLEKPRIDSVKKIKNKGIYIIGAGGHALSHRCH